MVAGRVGPVQKAIINTVPKAYVSLICLLVPSAARRSAGDRTKGNF